jgi:hypothetical protein
MPEPGSRHDADSPSSALRSREHDRRSDVFAPEIHPGFFLQNAVCGWILGSEAEDDESGMDAALIAMGGTAWRRVNIAVTKYSSSCRNFR